MARVLYVDDEPSISRAVAAWLTRGGATVDTARSLADARRCLAEHRYDGVFIDVWLPDGTGLDLLDDIRAEQPALAERAVFITGDAAPRPDVERRLASLGRPVIRKPFDLAALDPWVETWSAAAP